MKHVKTISDAPQIEQHTNVLEEQNPFSTRLVTLNYMGCVAQQHSAAVNYTLHT